MKNTIDINELLAKAKNMAQQKVKSQKVTGQQKTEVAIPQKQEVSPAEALKLQIAELQKQLDGGVSPVATQTAEASPVETEATETDEKETLIIYNSNGTINKEQKVWIALTPKKLKEMGYDGEVITTEIIKNVSEKLGITHKTKQKKKEATKTTETTTETETTQTATAFKIGDLKTIGDKTFMFDGQKLVPV